MSHELFDRRLRGQRRDRAARIGSELVLHDRAFDECLDRLRDIRRPFGSCLLIGCPSPEWPRKLLHFAQDVDAVDPGGLFAAAAGGKQVEEDRFDFGEDRYDLAIAVGTLDSVNELPMALKHIGRALKPGAPFIGAIAGGNSLPALRASLIEAGRSEGRVVARTHPRIDPPTLARLLSAAGFAMPVVDVDRVTLRYSDLGALVRDLRAMGASSMLADRPPPLSRRELQAARMDFEKHGKAGRTEEQIEIIHFLGWQE